MNLQTAERRSAPNEAFAEFVSSAKPLAIRICRQYRIPPHDAEDLMQQCLIQYMDQEDQVQHPRAWLAGTLRNHCRMYWRRQRRRVYRAVDTAILETLAEPEVSAQQTIEFRHDMGHVLDQLPTRCRAVLELRYGLGCPPAETAKRLGYRSSGIYKILERCIAAFSRSLTACGLVAEARSSGKPSNSVSVPAS